MSTDLDAPEHALCSETMARDKVRIAELEAHRRRWRRLAAELRNQESRTQGILVDVNWDSDDQVREALAAIDDIINGPEKP